MKNANPERSHLLDHEASAHTLTHFYAPHQIACLTIQNITHTHTAGMFWMPLRNDQRYTDMRLGMLEGRSKLMLRRRFVKKEIWEMNSRRSSLLMFVLNVFRAGDLRPPRLKTSDDESEPTLVGVQYQSLSEGIRTHRCFKFIA